MRKIIFGLVATAAIATPLVASATAASAATSCVDVPTTTGAATFTAIQPKDTVGQFDNVWKHDYKVTVNPDGTFVGNGSVTANGLGDVAWTEKITGQFRDSDGDAVSDRVTFNTTPNEGVTFSVTDAPTDSTTVPVASPWEPNVIEFQIAQPVFATVTTRVCEGIPTPAPVAGKPEVSHTDYQYADWNLRTGKWDYRWSHKNVGLFSIYDHKTWIRTGATQKHVEVPAVTSPLTGFVEWDYPSHSATGKVTFSGDKITYDNNYGESLTGTVTSYKNDGDTITLTGASTSTVPAYKGTFTLVIRDSNNDDNLDQIGLFVNSSPDDGSYATITGGTLTNA